jgi:hypothetical protein
LAAPILADLVNILLPGLGIPAVLLGLSIVIAWVAVISWRQNAALGLHQRQPRDDAA